MSETIETKKTSFLTDAWKRVNEKMAAGDDVETTEIEGPSKRTAFMRKAAGFVAIGAFVATTAAVVYKIAAANVTVDEEFLEDENTED